MEKGFGSLRGEIAAASAKTAAEIAAAKTETAKEFGAVRVQIADTKTEIEKVRTSIESAKVWLMGLFVGAVATIVGQAITLFLTLRK